MVVFGDLMLDVFSEGHASRLSPEAPVPVLANPVHRRVLGGAGNTALNVQTLGASIAMASIVGDDDAGRVCRKLLGDAGIEYHLVTDGDGTTTVKTRFVAAGQQIMRLDVESPVIAHSSHVALIDALETFAEQSDCMIISDYQKGAVSPDAAAAAMRIAGHHRIPVVVDSKCRDFSIYRGAALITPNHLEATIATGEEDPARAAEALARATGGDVIVTLGPSGMLVHTADGVERVPSQVREVSDVTGAGDTVTAAISVALAEGATPVEAARWATAAAAIAVEHRGTYAVRRDEVEQALAERATSLAS